MNHFKGENCGLEETIQTLKKKGFSIGIIIPTYNEEKTISKIIFTFLSSELVSNVYIIDDGSHDNTIMRARSAGAITFNRKRGGEPKYRKYNGKGFAIWEALALAKEDILIVYDGDIQNPDINHIIELTFPLINNPNIILTKASFDRNLYLQNHSLKREGGRITELLVKPLLGFLFPELILFEQPTGGIYGIKKERLLEIEILGETGADISILINLYKKNGLSSLCEVYLGEIIHNNKDLKNLSKITFKLIQSIFFLYNNKISDFEKYSYLSFGKKMDVNSPLIILKPRNFK